MGHRRMRDPDYLRSQVDNVYAPHVEPVNRLVDRLRNEPDRGWMPYVAPAYGGVEAQVLLLLRDPGPATHGGPGSDGSGFLSPQNDDPTAERLAALLDRVGLPEDQCTAWNSYPWYINKPPTSSQLSAGLDPLIELLGLLQRLRVVILLGAEARTMWLKVEKRAPALANGVRVIATRHTSNQAFIGSADRRAAWQEDQLSAFVEAAAMVRGENPAPRIERESDVQAAFVRSLEKQGWEVRTSSSAADVVATKGANTVIAEVKGVSTSPGLDVDTMYGQLLRRMTAESGTTRYAVVVPRSAAVAAARVSHAVRERLGIDAFVVDRDGTVTPLS